MCKIALWIIFCRNVSEVISFILWTLTKREITQRSKTFESWKKCSTLSQRKKNISFWYSYWKCAAVISLDIQREWWIVAYAHFFTCHLDETFVFLHVKSCRFHLEKKPVFQENNPKWHLSKTKCFDLRLHLARFQCVDVRCEMAKLHASPSFMSGTSFKKETLQWTFIDLLFKIVHTVMLWQYILKFLQEYQVNTMSKQQFIRLIPYFSAKWK